MKRGVLLVAAAIVFAGHDPALAGNKTIGTAAVQSADGAAKGQARLVRVGNRVRLRLQASHLPAGRHGVHLHAVGNCTAPDFASAGPHLNPHGRMHGMDNPQGSHLGDLPNLVIGRSGKGSLTAWLRGTPDELGAELFDADGTALVIHAGQDDYRTDPSGNSGGRIACGVIRRG
jgi:Cu-Zn family superoxide dismutase